MIFIKFQHILLYLSLVASGRSKGVRLVSARAEMKNRIKIGSSGIIYHTFC